MCVLLWCVPECMAFILTFIVLKYAVHYPNTMDDDENEYLVAKPDTVACE